MIKIPSYKYVETLGNVKGTIKDKDAVINIHYLKCGEEAGKTEYNNLILWVGLGILAIVIIFILNKNLTINKN